MKTLALAAAAGLMLSGVATAVFAADTTDKFTNTDANKDNYVSMEEAMGAYPTLTQPLFDQADANHDGQLDAGEFAALEGLTAGLDNGTTSAASDASSSDASSSDASSSASAAQ